MNLTHGHLWNNCEHISSLILYTIGFHSSDSVLCQLGFDFTDPLSRSFGYIGIFTNVIVYVFTAPDNAQPSNVDVVVDNFFM